MLFFVHIPSLTRITLIIFITVMTLVGIMLRPWKLNEALITLTGAGLLLILGLINLYDAFSTLIHDWNTFFFFLGMMSLSALAEIAGLFDWLALQAARLSGNSSLRLFLNTFLLGSLISMFLSNLDYFKVGILVTPLMLVVGALTIWLLLLIGG